MEFPHLGRNCAFRTCNRLDFLPYKCGACSESFCSDHFAYAHHDCPAPNTKDVQVPECPLCGAPVPGRRGEPPDVAVGEHIDNQCQSDPAKERRKKVYTNRCAYKGCKAKEMMPLVCNECELNFCLKHRHAADHACEGALSAKRRKAAEAAMARLQNGHSKKLEFKTRIESNPGRTLVATLHEVQGNLTEDEALARALSMSLQNSTLGGGDVAIARSLARRVGAEANQASWSQSRSYRPPRRYSGENSRGTGLDLNCFDVFKVVGGIVLTLYVLASLKYMLNTYSSASSSFDDISDIYDD